MFPQQVYDVYQYYIFCDDFVGLVELKHNNLVTRDFKKWLTVFFSTVLTNNSVSELLILARKNRYFRIIDISLRLSLTVFCFSTCAYYIPITYDTWLFLNV